MWVVDGYALDERSQPRELEPNEDGGSYLLGRWVNSHELRAGDKLVGQDGEIRTLIRTEQRYETKFRVCNLTINDNHTFAVGSDALLVHNTGGCLRARLGDPPKHLTRPQSHHDLPQAQRFKDQWDRVDLDINDPAHGRWVEGGPVGNHQKWSAEFNREWDSFFEKNPMASRQKILQKMSKLRADPRFQ